MVFAEINNNRLSMIKINTAPHPWDLRYFQEIANTQNLSRAAERLGVGQPALSLALKRLESRLGAALFYRRSKGLSLTSAGQRLLKASHQLLLDWEQIVSQTKKSETELCGRFRLGAHPSVAIYAFENVLREVYKAYPGIEIQLVHDLSRVISEQVISGEIEFGIVVNPVRHPDLVIHKLAVDQVGFWSCTHSLPEVLICNPRLAQTQILLQRLKRPFARTVTSDSLEVIAQLASSGLGTAILPSRVARVFTSKLVINDLLPILRDEITFIYRADLIKTKSTKCLIDAFKEIKI
jgi:DNA-binding transcriptional LysR family regulator